LVFEISQLTFIILRCLTFASMFHHNCNSQIIMIICLVIKNKPCWVFTWMHACVDIMGVCLCSVVLGVVVLWVFFRDMVGLGLEVHHLLLPRKWWQLLHDRGCLLLSKGEIGWAYAIRRLHSYILPIDWRNNRIHVSDLLSILIWKPYCLLLGCKLSNKVKFLLGKGLSSHFFKMAYADASTFLLFHVELLLRTALVLTQVAAIYQVIARK